MGQLQQGYKPPKLSKDKFITPIKPKRARELATHAFHFAMKIAALLSLDVKASDLKIKVECWYQAKGFKYVQLDPCAELVVDEEAEFEEET